MKWISPNAVRVGAFLFACLLLAGCDKRVSVSGSIAKGADCVFKRYADGKLVENHAVSGKFADSYAVSLDADKTIEIVCDGKVVAREALDRSEIQLGELGVASNAIAGNRIAVAIPQAAYERTQPVEVTLTNASPEDVRVYVNLEAMDNGEWVTWPFRAEDGRSDAISIIYPLASAASRRIAFDIRKIELPPLPPPIPGGQSVLPSEQVKFRFRVVALHKADDTRLEESFSDPFVIHWPYGDPALFK